MRWAFDAIKYLGAAYLVWLGIRFIITRPADLSVRSGAARSFRRQVLAGVLVTWSNPKSFLFFGAFLPQFVDPVAGNTFEQTLILGLVFMVVGAIFDSMYALIAGKAGAMLTRTRVRLVERISGTILIGGGIWLATLKRA